ncbi:hypothetical protein GCM10023177_14650 [Streptomyces violaceoruber]
MELLAGCSPVARAFCAVRQAATSVDGLASASDSGALIEPAGVAGASTLVGFVHGLSGSGSFGFGVAARPGAAAITTAAVVIAETQAVLCVLRARHMGVRAARECISFPPQEVRPGNPSGHQRHTNCHKKHTNWRGVPPMYRYMRAGTSPTASPRQTRTLALKPRRHRGELSDSLPFPEGSLTGIIRFRVPADSLRFPTAAFRPGSDLSDGPPRRLSSTFSLAMAENR